MNEEVNRKHFRTDLYVVMAWIVPLVWYCKHPQILVLCLSPNAPLQDLFLLDFDICCTIFGLCDIRNLLAY
jgi:hypothetical protein